MKLKRFNSYYYEQLAEELITSFDELVVESDETNWKSIADKIISDLNLNMKFVGTFGTGITAFYPIVESIMKNTQIPIDKTPEIVVMMTITAFTIIYLEEKKSKSEKEEEVLTKDSKSLLEELKLRGVGNGIIKKLIKSFKSMKNIFYTISQKLGAVVGDFIDMFAYTSLLIPIMNGILFIINKYQFNLDTIIENFIGLSVGVGTIVTKQVIVHLIKKLKDKFVISKDDKEEIVSAIDTPKIKRFDQIDGGEGTDVQPEEMINEQ